MARVSQRGATIQASPIRKLVPHADEAKKRGKKVYHLNIGQPDIPTPQPVLDAIRHFDGKIISYGHSQGLLELRQAVAGYFQRFGCAVGTEDVLISIAGSEAIHFAFSVVADTGDEILIPEPYYTNYNGYASFADVTIVPLVTKAEEGFHLPPAAEIERKITPRTRAILLCSPNNPTGTILTREELEGVAALALKHDLFLIGDEVYKEFAYDGYKHTSLLELQGLEDRVIVVDSVSKRFSACGARIGCVVTRNGEAMEALVKFAQARLCPPMVEQLAALAAYRMDPAYFDPIRAEYQRRRDAMFEALSRIDGVVLKKPRGAFYMIVKLPIADSDHFAQWLLDAFDHNGETVMVAPGSGFYGTPTLGHDEVRLAYVLCEEDIKKAMVCFEEGLREYRSVR
jgi:aspartate aminotransferase